MQQRPDRLGAQEHGLDHAAGVQQPVGEDVAAVGVGAELDLVHRQELGVAVERHGLDGAGEPARLGRDDLLLAGDQGDVAGALLRHHPVVVLAGEQAEGEADDAGGVRQQALDGEMGLAGVRRAEDGFDAGGETGVETGHGEMVGCCGAECKRRGGQIGWGAGKGGTGSGGVRAADGPSIMARRTAENRGAQRRAVGVRRRPTVRLARHAKGTVSPRFSAVLRANTCRLSPPAPAAHVLSSVAPPPYARRRCGIRAIASVGAERCGQSAALVNQRSRGRSVAQPGSASVWGTGGRGFKSRRSDQSAPRYKTINSVARSLQPFIPDSGKAG